MDEKKISRELEKIRETDRILNIEDIDETEKENKKSDKKVTEKENKKSDKKVTNKEDKNSEENKALRKMKRKRRTAVKLCISLALVLIGGVVTFGVFKYEEHVEYTKNRVKAQNSAVEMSKETLRDYVSYIPKAKYDKMYKLVDNATKEKRAQENFAFVNKAFYGYISLIEVKVDIKKCIIPEKEELQQDGIYIEDQYNASNTRIDYTTTVVTDGGEFSFDKSIDLIREDEEWHIIWDSSLIYPEYKPMDVVKNSYASALRGDILDRNDKKLATMKKNARYYPYSRYAAHLVGFISRITDAELQEKFKDGQLGYSNSSIVGKKGLEYAYETTVKGAGGQTIKLFDSNGTEKCTIMDSEPKQGKTLKTTIDVDVQKALYNEIKNENACSVAINPYTGEILAMVSTPSYNNNEVIKGKAADTFNRFSRAYCPGSTFKPITGAIGLDCGAFTKDTNFGPSPKRWQKSKAWGSLFVTTQHQCRVGTLINGITLSDNVYFAKAALKIGSSDLKKGLDKLGFNEDIPFEMIFSPSQYSNTDSFTSEAMLANSGYGQGQILINPLHLATIYSAFLNKGDMVKPVFEYSGETEYWLKDVFKENTAETIKECLENVVNSGSGTGYAARSYRMKIAGKTGTAEIKASQTDQNGTELGWFVAMTTDADKDKAILIVTMVEDVEPKGGSAYVVGKTKRMLKSIYGNEY